MTEQEKVIRGLEDVKLIIPDFVKDTRDNNWIMRRIDNALFALRKQEPKVIDADQIVLSAEPSGWLWLEKANRECGEAYKRGKTLSGLIVFETGFDENRMSFRPEDYMKTWRCWTSRPTDEQRGKVKWE